MSKGTCFLVMTFVFAVIGRMLIGALMFDFSEPLVKMQFPPQIYPNMSKYVQMGPTVGRGDFGQQIQIILSISMKTSVTKRSWLVKSKKFYGGRHTHHEMCPFARISVIRQQSLIFFFQLL